MKQETKNKKTNFIADNYKKSFDYLKESRKYIYAILILFFIFVLMGFFVPAPPGVYEKILEFIKDILEKTQGMDALELISFIFFNNLKVSILSIVLGILFGVIPIAFSITNGYLLGFVASITVQEEGIFVLLRLLPHGIFELPAVFISLALGLRLGLYFFMEQKEKLSNNLLNTLRVFVFVILPLLVIAAIIEGYLIAVSR